MANPTKDELNVTANEMWNSASIYGPPSEIARFKQLCIVADTNGRSELSTLTIDFNRIIPLPADYDDLNDPSWPCDHWGTNDDAWNFRELREEVGHYSFAFDTYYAFPRLIFERLAELFPRLAFECECIESTDAFMGFGWFNAPPDGEAFSDHYAVPEDFWTIGNGCKREPESHARCEALCAALTWSAARAEGDPASIAKTIR